MRTNINIDDELMAKAMKAAGTKTKKETVEEGLKALVKRGSQRKIKEAFGKFQWEGNLDTMRTD
ncbi:MAG: type II toxin-antitoxin system VapB family antitoxin [Anderseniella sp.]